MRHERTELPRLQRWMQEVVVYPGAVEEAIASPRAAREIAAARLEEVVTPSHSMTSSERLGVYHGMYLLRMQEALEADYPVIRYHLGDHRFALLVRDYVQRYPSTSYTLNRLGDHLPRFFLDEPDRPHAAFLHDLARLELAMTEVFDEEETPALGVDAVQAVDPAAWETARLRPIRALRLLALEHAVIPHLSAFHDDRPAPEPRRVPCWIALYRRDYSVLRLELGRSEHDLLSWLVSGTPLGEALAAAAGATRGPRQQARIFRWFRTWISEGLFSAIEV